MACGAREKNHDIWLRDRAVDLGVEVTVEMTVMLDCVEGVVTFVLILSNDVGEMGGDGILSGEGVLKFTGDAGKPLSL